MALGKRQTAADESIWRRSSSGFIGLDQVSKWPVCAFRSLHVRVAIPYNVTMPDQITRRQDTMSENHPVV